MIQEDILFVRYNLATGLAAHALYIICAILVEGLAKDSSVKLF